MTDLIRLTDGSERGIGSRLAAVFLLVAVPWILISDLLLQGSPNVVDTELVQTLKGLLFVFLCAVMLKYFGDRYNARLLASFRRERRLREHLVRAEQVGEIGSWEWDLRDGVCSCTEGCHAIFDGSIKEKDRFEEALLEKVMPEDRERVKQARESWWRDGGVMELEYRIEPSQGRKKWVAERAEVLPGSDGKERYAVGTIQDITSLKITQAAKDEAEELARRRASLVRMAAEKAHFGGWRYEIGDEYEIWSEGTALVRGLRSDIKISPAEAMEHYANGDSVRMRQLFETCIETGEAFDDVFKMNTVDGEYIRVRTFGEPEYDQEGNIVAVQGGIQDVTELISARAEADRQNAELQSVLASMGDGFITIDHEWRVTFINHKGSELFGLSPTDLQDRNFWEIFPEARGTGFERKCCDAVNEGESRSAIEFVSKISRWLEVSIHPTPEGLAIYFRDCSEQQATRQWLRLLESAVQNLDDILTVASVQQAGSTTAPEVIYVNNAIEQQLGYRPDEILREPPWALIDSKESGSGFAKLREAADAGNPASAEVVMRCRSGEKRWFEVRTSPISERKGTITHRAAIFRDITERKLYEERILQSEERFRLISRASSDVIWDWNIETGAFWLSDNYEDVFGFDISDEPQTFDASIARIHPDDQERIRRSLMDTIHSERSIWNEEYRVRRADGSFSTVEDHAFVIRDAEGRAVRMVAGMTDVTEIRELDAKLRASQKLEAIGHLTGGVAHDFNNLLTIILGNAELLTDSVADPQQRQMSEAILQAAERGASLTDGLLAFSRRQPLEPQPVDVNQLIQSSETLLRQSIEEGIELTCYLCAEEAVVVADPARLQTAIMNLVINSRHAIDERGTITIESQNRTFDKSSGGIPSGRYVVISVSDDGTGMPEHVAERAFEPFFSTKGPGEGTGLGLSSVYGFVKQSGGEARIYSELGEGTSVHIYLPSAEEAPNSFSEVTAEEVSPAKGEHILVVEDDPDLRRHAGSQLRSLGYRVSIAEDADAALAVMDREPDIDLLFTDVIMPGSMHGADLARAAEKRRPDLKILFTSGYTKNIVLHKARLDDEVELLGKPYRREDLARRVREKLEN